ncbi:MAG: toprim domain-containing protein [Bauldia sp.]
MNLGIAARILGGDTAGSKTVLCPGPGHSPRDRSLSVTFAESDFTVFSHAGDDWRACKDEVRRRLGLAPFSAARGPAPVAVAASVSRGRGRLADALWREGRPIDGTPAEAYLARRGVSYDGDALRWHPSCPFGPGVRQGCMIALVRNIVTNAAQAVHRTALDADGRKIGRKASGPISGGAVKLTPDEAVTRVIAIAEGIETALSIRALPDLGAIPVWSVLSAGGIAAFPVLPGIETVWIAADNDASGTGQRATRAAALRMHAAGIETIILSPTRQGLDLNDRVARNA